jgi:hypothetical protein
MSAGEWVTAYLCLAKKIFSDCRASPEEMKQKKGFLLKKYEGTVSVSLGSLVKV